GQAATAMAAVAMVVWASTFYFHHDGGSRVTADNNQVIAAVNVAPKTPEPTLPVTGLRSEVKPAAVMPAKSTTARAVSRGFKSTPATFRSEAPAEVIASRDIASANSLPRFYSRETRQVVQDRNAFGAELVSVNAVKSAAIAPSF